MKVLVTGAKGFIGRNLCVALQRLEGTYIREYDLDSAPGMLEEGLASADVVFHLAGVNRPQITDDFIRGNVDLTKLICEELRRLGRKPLLAFSSSSQATLDNPYGQSKRQAEEAILSFGAETASRIAIFRLPGVFGKWCRPNYNSVIATFCHNRAKGLPINISDENRKLDLVYIDDVIKAFLLCITNPPTGSEWRTVSPQFDITLGELARRIESFRESRQTHVLDDFGDPFVKRLYATYMSYIESSDFAYELSARLDERGKLVEFLKHRNFGQIFVSRTRAGITRGHHYHDTKVEKFLILEGEAIVRFQKIDEDPVIEYKVRGNDFRVIDIPPGYTHSIENIGSGELITLFWADEIFNPAAPDTFALKINNRLEVINNK